MAQSQSQQDAVARIRKSIADARGLHGDDEPMDLDTSATEARLEQTVRELQARVNEQQAALEQVREYSTKYKNAC